MEQIAVFLENAANYFWVSTQKKAKIGTPFLIDDMQPYLKEYTGVVGVFGEYKGVVLFSAQARMLMHMTRTMGLVKTQPEHLLDLVGEISNTFSGNARAHFGADFGILPPETFLGEAVELPSSEVKRFIVIPIHWDRFEAFLIVNLDHSDDNKSMYLN